MNVSTLAIRNVQIKFFAVCLTLAFVAGTAPRSRADVGAYQKALGSTVWLLAKTDGETSSGTGVLIDADKKLVITNYHVVGEARAAVIFFPSMKDGQPIVTRKHYLDNVKTLGIRGRVLSVDRKRDLALVELDKLPSGTCAISMAKESIGPGEDIQSVGNPGSTDALWVYTSGAVRSVYKKTFRTGAGEHEFRVVETQAPINSGDSGGPVVNNDGELVAIAQAIAPNARLVSYNVDISEVREFLASPWKPAPLPAADLLTKADLTYSVHKTGHLEVEVDDKTRGKHSVFVTKDVEYFERADVRKIWALSATLKNAPSLDVVMRLMEQNARTKLGAWMIERNEQNEFMLIYCVKLDATATPEVVKSTIEYVAQLTLTAREDLTPKEVTLTSNQSLEMWLSP